MKKCEECGTLLPCINKYGFCKECDEQFLYCYPCRTKEEQKQKFDKWKLDWDK